MWFIGRKMADGRPLICTLNWKNFNGINPTKYSAGILLQFSLQHGNLAQQNIPAILHIIN